MATQLDLSTIQVEKIIVHDIPKHKKDDLSNEPKYSEQESEITDGLRFFFKDKVVEALGRDKAFKICIDPESESPVPWLLSDLIKDEDNEVDFVEQSKKIAKHLFEIQKGNNAAGILVVIQGKINDHRTCVILKLERDQGAQLSLDPITKSFNIIEVKNLMLTQKTKVFKVALFISREKFGSNFDGSIMDYQNNPKVNRTTTTFFISLFLGCIPFEDPKISTKKFFSQSRAFIDTIEDPVVRTKYIQDLNSYVQMNSSMINPKEFADNYLESTSERNDYKNFLESKDIKFVAFPKDTQLIDNRIKKIMLTFENGISIMGSKGVFDDKVKLETLNSGQHKAEIVSRIKKVG